jgi:hypothetical protein
MEMRFAAPLLAAGVLLALPARAHNDASELSAISMLPVASVMVVGSAAGAVLAGPVALAAAGGELVVRGVESSAHGTICVLERVSDGARVILELAGRGIGNASLAVGTVITATAIGAGTVLSAAGEVIAFVPNAVGQSLLHNQRLTY